jgi:SPP1 family predicted phage head-tail adaptor
MNRAGEMRHRVTLQERQTIQDDAGEPNNTWNTFATRWAAVQRAATGSEEFASAMRNGRVPVTFRLRYLETNAGETITPAMRLVWQGKVHNILSVVDPDGRKSELIITAQELVEESAS